MTAMPEPHEPASGAHATRGRSAALALGALGVVYGDIGTSPLYALKECVNGPHGVAPTPENVFGILSLVTWALLLVVVVKYLTFIMRADNQGEGGILALFALVIPKGAFRGDAGWRARMLMYLGLFGAGLLFGESMLTPAISVLSAVEGLGLITTRLGALVVPITCVILVALFMVQRFGTGKVGMVFGWVMLVWFTVIGFAGVVAIWSHPGILAAANPLYGMRFFLAHGWHGFFVLGGVVLVITGGEALYADMGHFGRRAIRMAWYALVLPGLLLNYYGQGAELLANPAARTNPFYALAPGWTLYPMVLLATAAAVIASQALISGIFSVTRQAVQLNYWPRVRVVHTSAEEAGQIYIPEINYLLMIGCICLVLGFRSSSGLAAAYGIAVTGTMTITSILFYVVARDRWRWSKWAAGSLVALFLVVDLAFFSANVNKIAAGGWIPLAIGAVVFAVMTTWRRGRLELGAKIAQAALPIELFLDDVKLRMPPRVKGTAVFMTSTSDGTPGVLLHHFKHNKVLHEQVVLLSVKTERVPIVRGGHAAEVTELGNGFFRVIARIGFMQDPDVPRILEVCGRKGLVALPGDTSYYLGRETLIMLPSGKNMAIWRKVLFSFLSRNARPATQFFRIPPNRVVEMGAQIEL